MDPLVDIEDAKAQHDIGVIAHRVYMGAREDGASRIDAYSIVFAWFKAMIAEAGGDDDE